MTPVSRRWLVWGALLLASGYLALFGDKTPAGTTAPSVVAQTMESAQAVAEQPPTAPADPVAAPPDAPADEGTAAPLPLVERRALIHAPAASAPDLFGPRSWTPAPPPVALPPPMAPTAPPLPFSYVGKKQQAGQWEVYLDQGELSFAVHAGETVGGIYRVTKIVPPTITLLYLPLKQEQTMDIGE